MCTFYYIADTIYMRLKLLACIYLELLSLHILELFNNAN